MITVSTEIPVGEMLLDWARAEPARITKCFPAFSDLAARGAAGASLTKKEIGQLVGGLLTARGVFVGHFISHPTQWLAASCPVADIGALNLCTWFERYPDLVGHPNLRTVAELAHRDPNCRLPTPFDKAKMRGRPILVSDSVGGPWCLVEGTHRLAEIFRLVEAGKPPFEILEIVVGVCPEAKVWYSWRSQ
jgi:hypothetical protein